MRRSHDTIVVSEATAGDLPAIAALHTESWRQNYRGILPDALFGAPVEVFMAQKWAGPLARRRVFVAREGARLLGFVAIYPNHADGIFVDNLHVHPDAKGRGLGRSLMARIAAEAKGRPIWLEVLEANHATRAVYRAWGGQEGEVFPDKIMGVVIPGVVVRWPDPRDLLQRRQSEVGSA